MSDELFRKGQFSEALESFRREANLRMLGCTLEALGQLEAAEEHYGQAILQAAWDARTHLALAGYLARRERWQPAHEAAEAGIRCPYATPQVKFELGVIVATVQMKSGQLPKAVETLAALERSAPNPVDLAWLRSKLFLLLGRKAEAQALIEHVHACVSAELTREPGLSARWTLLGDCNYARGDLEGAYRAYDRALQCNPIDWAACRGMGILAEKRGESEQARSFYAKFLQLDPLNLSGPAIRQRLSALDKQAQAH